MLTTAITDERVLEAVERLRPVLEKFRDDGERERRLPEPLVQAMKNEGLFDLWLPKEYGGRETDLLTLITAVETVSTVDASAGWVFANVAAGASQAALLDEGAAREIFGAGNLTAGSVIPRGRAIPVDGGYSVTGRWPLASGCYHADWIGANCLIFDGDAPRMSPEGMPEFTLMFFPASDCKILDTWDSTGMRGTGSADVAVEEVYVPAERTFPVFTARPRVPGAIFRLGLPPLFFTALTNVGLGIARAAIDEFVEIAKGKTPTLSQTGLAVRPTIHAEVARAEALLQSARAYLHQVAREMMVAIAAADHLPDEVEARRRLACTHAAEACEKVVDTMFRLGGTSVIYTGSRLDRCLRDIHTVNQHLGVSPVWWEKTGQYYFGMDLGMP